MTKTKGKSTKGIRIADDGVTPKSDSDKHDVGQGSCDCGDCGCGGSSSRRSEKVGDVRAVKKA